MALHNVRCRAHVRIIFLGSQHQPLRPVGLASASVGDVSFFAPRRGFFAGGAPSSSFTSAAAASAASSGTADLPAVASGTCWESVESDCFAGVQLVDSGRRTKVDVWSFID